MLKPWRSIWKLQNNLEGGYIIFGGGFVNFRLHFQGDNMWWKSGRHSPRKVWVQYAVDMIEGRAHAMEISSNMQ
eukprot:c17626_g2_i1 orf=355-576(-)